MQTQEVNQLGIFNQVVPKEVLYKVQCVLNTSALSLLNGLQKELRLRGFDAEQFPDSPHITLFHFRGLERWEDALALKMMDLSAKAKPCMIRLSGLDSPYFGKEVHIKLKNKHELLKLNQYFVQAIRMYLLTEKAVNIEIGQQNIPQMVIAHQLSHTELEVAYQVLGERALECAFMLNSVRLIKESASNPRAILINEFVMKGA